MTLYDEFKEAFQCLNGKVDIQEVTHANFHIEPAQECKVCRWFPVDIHHSYGPRCPKCGALQ